MRLSELNNTQAFEFVNGFFAIKESQSERYDFLVLSTKGENVLNRLGEVEKEISNRFKAGKKSRILFDTLLYAGNTPDRFIHADYNDGAFDRNSFEFVNVPKKDHLREQSLNFFIDHSKYIENSTMLNSIQKKIILKGITI